MTAEERTVQSIFNLWFWNFQNPSLQQFSSLFHTTISIIKFYNNAKKYDSDIEQLKQLYFHPIINLREIYPELVVSKNPLNWDIPKLEWCYYRDTKFKSKLATEYYIDARKIQETRKMLLGELITTLSLFKFELFNRIIKILIDEKIELNIPYPSKEIESLGSGEIV